MVSLSLSLLTAIARRAKSNFLQKIRQTEAVQEQFLRQVLQTHRDTELGRNYGLREIKTIDRFRDRIPVLPYSGYEYLEDTAQFGAVYASAEGTFSIYHDLNSDGSILAVETVFCEFIPESQWQAEHPKTLLATEVKVGERYRILVTNYSGFYRYDIGDVVEVLGFYETAPLLVFRYRRGGLLSSTTEKTTEAHATEVMQTLQQEFGLPLEDFCITLSENDFPPRYLVNIELASGESLDNPQRFLHRFDDKLKDVNPSYGDKRRMNLVPPPYLRILAPGSFLIVRQRQLQRGIPDFQLKFPHISEDRNFLAGLVVEQEVMWQENGFIDFPSSQGK
jgi:hypothetical protein